MFSLLKAYWIKIRTWGLPGVLNYLRSLRWHRHIQSNLIRDARRHPCPYPERGITLIGQFTRQASHSKTMRDLAWALKAAGIPYQTLNTDDKPNIPMSDISDILTPPGEFHIKRFDHVVEILPSIVPSSLHLPLSRIAFWEFESGFLHAYPDMPLSKRVIAMSDFNANYFKTELPPTATVAKILYPFHAYSGDL